MLLLRRPRAAEAAQGNTVSFTCTQEGSFPIHFMVWDEHHDVRRERVENIEVNKGRNRL